MKSLPLVVAMGVGICASLVVASHARAAMGIATATYGRDNLGIYGERTDMKWFRNETDWGLLQTVLHATRAGGADLAAIPSGDRWTSAGGGLGWVTSFGALESRALAGMDVISQARSWRLQLEERFAVHSLSGLDLKAGVASGWLDGWLTYGVRSTAVTGSVEYGSDTTWADVGIVWDARMGGVQPGTELRVSLPNNQLVTAYGWATHAWLTWLMAGAAVSWNDSAVDLHQPVRLVNGVATYLDYPYPTQHRELAFGGLLELRVGRFSAKANWPFFSTGQYRADDPDPMAAPSFYPAHGMTVAEVRGGMNLPIGDWNMAIDIQSLSRPYRPYAWFTADSWTQVGLSLTVRYATASARSVE